MPTYEYRCKDCGDDLEVVQSFDDDPLTECESCGGRLKKVFGSIGISFKGSGFYKTDARGASPATASSNGAEAKGDSASEPKGDAASETKGDTTGAKGDTAGAKDAGGSGSGADGSSSSTGGDSSGSGAATKKASTGS